MLIVLMSRFAGIFALPHFTLTNESYDMSKSLLLSSISAAIKKQEVSSHFGAPWQPSSDQFSNQDPRCEYIVYLQLHPIAPPTPSSALLSPFPIDSSVRLPRPMTPESIHRIEQELRHPTGAPVPVAPPIILSSIIYSPTCGFVLGTKKSKGLKVESYYNKASNFALSAAAVMVAQIWLLIRQMNESNTPSTVSRVSFWTMAMMSVVDGYLTMAFLAVAIFVGRLNYVQSGVTCGVELMNHSRLLLSTFGFSRLLLVSSCLGFWYALSHNNIPRSTPRTEDSSADPSGNKPSPDSSSNKHLRQRTPGSCICRTTDNRHPPSKPEHQ